MNWIFACFVLFADMFEFKRPPAEVLGIESEKVEIVPEEKILRVCREGAEEIPIHQVREVIVEQGKEIQMERHCNWHEEEIGYPDKKRIWFDSYDTATRLKAETEARLRSDPSIAQFNVWITEKKKGPPYRVKARYWHKPNSPNCPRCNFVRGEAPGPVAGKTVKRCKGHWVAGSAHKGYDDAVKKKGEKERAYAGQGMAAYKVYLGQYKDKDGDYRLDSEYRHPDNHPACSDYVVDQTSSFPAKEKSDRWVSPGKLAALEKDPRCRMAQLKNGKPETRNIQGLAVARDAWERDIILQCRLDSECGELRRAGGVLVKEECLKKDEQGRCLYLEKSYDFGTKPGYTKVKTKFKDGKIWGWNGEFDDYKQKYDKRSDFPKVAAALSTVMGMYKADQKVDLENPDLPQLYLGEVQSCRCNMQGASPFDCCEKGAGGARCSAGELKLAEAKAEGRVHYVGTRKDKESNTEHVYCSFATKIGRIVQEEARKKLGLGWGSAEVPDCLGLTQKEYAAVAEKLDLSEAYDDYEKKGEEIALRMREKIKTQFEKARKGG